MDEKRSYVHCCGCVDTRCEGIEDQPAAEHLVSLLRECQSALTGPMDLRQRIEDAIGSRRARALDG